MEITIRDMTIDDLPEVQALAAQEFNDPGYGSTFRALQGLGPEVVARYFNIVAVGDGKVVGYATANPLDLGKPDGTPLLRLWGETALLPHMAVQPDFRGRGIGTKLHARITSMALGPFRQVMAHIEPTMVDFYTLQGWRVAEPDTSVVWMEAPSQHDAVDAAGNELPGVFDRAPLMFRWTTGPTYTRIATIGKIEPSVVEVANDPASSLEARAIMAFVANVNATGTRDRVPTTSWRDLVQADERARQ